MVGNTGEESSERLSESLQYWSILGYSVTKNVRKITAVEGLICGASGTFVSKLWRLSVFDSGIGTLVTVLAGQLKVFNG